MKLVEVRGSAIRAVEEPRTPLLADEVEFARLNIQHRQNVQPVRLLDLAEFLDDITALRWNVSCC
jgi:hypothetical protein